jgi:hypothetical protein
MSGAQDLLLGNFSTAATGYQIERSLRFNSADSAYLNRTPASTSNRRTFTISCWAKLCVIPTGVGEWYTIFSAGDYASATPSFTFQIVSGNFRVAFWTSSSYNGYFFTDNLVRDLSAWYHFVVAVDTTQATASNRVKLYYNNQLAVGTGVSDVAQNYDTGVNLNQEHLIGAFRNTSLASYGNQYLTEFNFIDGQALTPSSFGETDADTGVWKPKAYSGSYGTNGFYLKFADNSGTTSTTLGKDSSGNGNNWTPNNFFVTAGANNDSLVDTPTPYGTDTGAGGEVRGNYCTFNPVANPVHNTVSDGSLLVSRTAGGPSGTGSTLGTIGVSSGKYYWEIYVNATPNPASIGIGIVPNNFNYTTGWVGDSSASTGYWGNGSLYGNTTGGGTVPSYTTGDTIGVALDMDAGTVRFYKNGSAASNNITGVTGIMVPAVAIYDNVTASLIANFGQRPFAYTAPSGFKALCATNIPTPPNNIGATATTQADNYFNVVARTFTAASATITGLGFSPDFLWFKRRNVAASHSLYDSVRGTNARLLSNDTLAEVTTTSAELTSFDSDGFTVGSDPGSISINAANGDTGVVWCWRGSDSAPVTNNSGTIQSTVSANTTAGFSIVTYTGTGAVATVGHGLGVKPSFILTKSRNNVEGWGGYHVFLGATYGIFLNLTDAAFASAGYWNDTEPTSNVFTVNLNQRTGASGWTYVAYCFAPVAGYSNFGSFVGNGSTNGAFVYTGFRPAFVMMKCSSDGSADKNWGIFDNKRIGYNSANYNLRANTSVAETTDSEIIDLTSNGFKIRSTSGGFGGTSGATYIYAAFAEFPFKYTLAR